MTSRQYGKRAVFVSGDVIFQDGDAGDLGKLGGGGALSSVFSVCRSMYTLAIVHVVIIYTHRLPLYYGAAAYATFGYFLCTMHVKVRAV